MKTLIILCIIEVVTKGNIPFSTNAQVEGKLLSKNEHNYLVDFSEFLKNSNIYRYDNSYKNMIVPKNKCIEIEK